MKLSAITAILTVCLMTSCTPQISNKNIKDSSKTQNIQKETTMEQVRNRCRSMGYSDRGEYYQSTSNNSAI